jgi:hypothetical protein
MDEEPEEDFDDDDLARDSRDDHDAVISLDDPEPPIEEDPKEFIPHASGNE